MEYKRINGMIDINEALRTKKIIFDEYEKHGARKNKFWFNNYQWMYKDTCNEYETYEEYAELISYEIAKLLEINCAEYDLAQYNGNKGVITKSVVKDNEKMISGTELLNTVFDEYFYPKRILYENFIKLQKEYQISSIEEFQKLRKEQQQSFQKKLISYYNQSCFTIKEILYKPQETDFISLFEYCKSIEEVYNSDFTDMKNGIIHANNLYDIWSAVEIYAQISGYNMDSIQFMNDLIKVFLFDIITSQGDRHADNWSIIVDENDNIRLAGIYDNSGSFALNREKAIKNINDLSERLKKETRPPKRQGIHRQLKNTIEHSFSGIKVTIDQVINRSKNEELLEMFVKDSADEFSKKLEEMARVITDENIEIIFQNIEKKTNFPVPNIVKNVVKEVLRMNKETIEDVLSKKEEDKNGNKSL